MMNRLRRLMFWDTQNGSVLEAQTVAPPSYTSHLVSLEGSIRIVSLDDMLKLVNLDDGLHIRSLDDSLHIASLDEGLRIVRLR